jgi:hypothetical protein
MSFTTKKPNGNTVPRVELHIKTLQSSFKISSIMMFVDYSDDNMIFRKKTVLI